MSLFRKNVLVTGADGFIGSHLVERLLEEGSNVRALCLYNSTGSHGWLDDIPTTSQSEVDLRLGDIRDADFVRGLVTRIDVVFHLAALISVPYSYEAPRSFMATNAQGTLNLLEAVRHAGTSLMINTSTSEVYGTPKAIPITELHPLQAQSPYSASKIAADKLCEAFAHSFDTPVVTLRPFNTYGPRQSMRAVIPTILTQLLAGFDRVRLGSLYPRRDFTFVDDTVDGFVRMASATNDPGVTIHLGSGETVSIKELFELCCEVVGVDATPQEEADRIRPPKSEVDVLLSDPTIAREKLGWRPRTPLQEGLETMEEWLRNRPGPRRTAAYHR